MSAQGARTIMRHKDAGVPNSQIAGMVGTSESTVRKVVQAARAEGGPRVPRQGKGKKDDSRWVFAGPRGGGNLAALENLHGRGRADDLLTEVHARLVAEGVIDMCAYRTMCKAMQKHLGYTLKMARLRLPPCSRLSRCTSPRDVPPSTRVFLACAPHVAAPRRPAALRESAAWPSSSSPTTRSTCRSSSAFARSSSSCGTSPSSSTHGYVARQGGTEAS